MQLIDLSIIIVNYNVKHFLEQCLRSVQQASVGLSTEVILVDNQSQDGSQAMIRSVFAKELASGWLTFIDNQDNPGFSKANNQGIAVARGRYVLLLNPDTVVGETTFTRCLEFADTHPDCGGLGIYMLDGQGVFLPESKRALPTPWVSFYKIFGLSNLFPRSKRFGRYHLSYLSKDQNHPIEILSGAYMWLRKDLLDQIGYLDETFFMYGEDIDLSYRVLLADAQNYYLADAKIIHYKGESTKKGSLNYVRVFYQAMIIFAQKHFGGRQKQLFILAIRLAVYLRALLAVGQRIISRLGFPLLEGGLIYATMYGVQAYWEHYIRYIEGGEYPLEFIRVYLPAYTLIFLGFLWGMGAYKRPFRLRPLMLAPLAGFITIATGTYMFSFIQNFSRAIVGLSAVFTMLLAIATRGVLNQREKGNFFFTEASIPKLLIISTADKVESLSSRIKAFVQTPMEVIGWVSVGPTSDSASGLACLGSKKELASLIAAYDIDEIVFDQGSLAHDEIFSEMIALQDSGVSMKIAPATTEFIIGPKTVWAADQEKRFAIENASARTQKRWLDVASSLMLILSYPMLFWRYQHPLKVPRSLWEVLVGSKHLVGYFEQDSQAPSSNLPRLKKGLLHLGFRTGADFRPQASTALDQFYARYYHWTLDAEIIWRSWRYIGG